MYSRNICIALLLLALLFALPSGLAIAQTCDVLTATDPDANGFNALPLGSTYPTAPAEYFAGDFFGYTITTPNGVVKLGYYDASGVFVSNEYHTFTANVAYTIDVHTAAIAVYRASVFTATVCTPTPPTATPTVTNTPVPPTVTFTPEVIVTATPVPTPTVNPQDVLVERANQSFQLNIFLGAGMLGMLVLVYFSRR